MRKRILLVARENDIIQSIPITLKLAGHRVMVADSGLEAIKQTRTLLPDLVLVDAALPDMDGATVVDILRRLPSTGRVPSLLFKPRWRVSTLITPAQRDEVDSINSTELLARVALALQICETDGQETELLTDKPEHFDL